MIAARPQRVCLLFPKFNEGFVMGKVPLGLSYLAGALMQAGIEVTGHNLNCDDEDTIDWTHWDWYGMTLLTPLVPEVNRLAAKIRAKNPHARIVCGGTHATLSTAMSFKQIPDLDYIVAGEGEFAFRDLVLDESRKAQIAGVYWRNPDGSIGGSKHKKLDIKTIPLPEQRVFDHGNLEKRNPFRSIMASRGCPYRCQNCQPNLDVTQPAGLRPPEDVLDEMRIRQERYGETYFGFIDSYMPYNKSWMQKFFPLVQSSGLKIEHHANARSDHLDREMLSAFKAMNISRLAVGIESGVDRVANDILVKRIDLKQTREVFHIGQVELDVRMHGHFMIGIPGETKDDWKRTLEYAIDLPAASIEMNILTPWPGTGFWPLALKNGWLSETDPSKFNEKRGSFLNTPEWQSWEVDAYYEEIRSTLKGLGYHNSRDGSVYFHPKYAKVIDQ
jgi:radical SAM superfamily enzyme YgiQ (UPF0313 family)